MGPALTIAAVELRRIAQDRTVLLFVLVLPVAVIVVIGSTFAAAPTSLPVGVVVLDESGGGAESVDALERSDEVSLRTYGSRADLDVALRTGVVRGGVVVDGASLTLVLDQVSPGASAVRSTLAGVFARVGSEASVAGSLGVERSVVEEVSAGLAPVEVVRDELDTGGLGSSTSPYAYTAPSNLVLFTFINSLTLAGVLVLARRSGITTRWAAAPVRAGTLVAGVVLSRLGFALAQALIIVVLGAVLFEVSWGDPLGVAVLVVLFGLVSTGAGVLLGVLARTEEQTSALGVPLGIGLAMLGGCMWPLEVVGPAMRTVGLMTPHGWAMEGFIALIFDGEGVGAILPHLAVLAAFAAVLLGASAALLRRRLV